jgi:hypothetical protein
LDYRGDRLKKHITRAKLSIFTAFIMAALVLSFQNCGMKLGGEEKAEQASSQNLAGELSNARGRWAQAKVSLNAGYIGYRYVIRETGAGNTTGGVPFTVSVPTNGIITMTSPVGTGPFTDTDVAAIKNLSVDKMFDVIEVSLKEINDDPAKCDNKKGSVSATFDNQGGYPTSFSASCKGTRGFELVGNMQFCRTSMSTCDR